MKKSHFQWVQAFLLAVCFLPALPGHGQTTWNAAADGNWTTAGNWSNGVPSADAASLTPTGASYTVTFDSATGFSAFTGLTLGNSTGFTTDLAVNAAGFALGGNFTLNSGGQVDVNSGGVFTESSGIAQLNAGSVFDVNAGGTATLRNGGMNGAGKIAIASGGALTTSGSGNFTLTVASSTNAGTWTNAASGGIVISGGATLTNTGTLSSSVNSNTTLSVGNDSAGTFNMNGGTLNNTLSGSASSPTGVSIGSAFGSSGVVGTFNMTAGTSTNTGSLVVGYSKQNTAVRSATGNFTMSGGTWNNSTAADYVIFGANTTTGTAAANDNNALTGNATISGTAAFTSAGSAIFGGGGGTGVLNMQGGTFTVGSGGTTKALVLGTDGSAYGGAVTTVGTGTLNLSGGTMNLDSLQAVNGAKSVINFTGGTLNVNTANVNGASALTVGDGTHAATLNLASASGSYTFAQGLAISANGVFQSAAGSVSVTSTTVTNGGTIAVGGSGAAGQLTLAGATALSLAAGSALTFELGGTGQGTQYDFLSVGGAATLGGALDISFINGFQNTITSGETFTLLTDAGGFGGSVFSNIADGGTLTTAYGTFTVDYSGNSIILSDFQAVAAPEPGTAPLAGVGLGALFLGGWIARRRAAQAGTGLAG